MQIHFRLLSIILIVIACQKVTGKELLDSVSLKKLQNAINSIPVSKLPLKFKIDNDNSHWCCKINVPPVNIQKTRLSTRKKIQTVREKCGSASCGFLGTSRCTKWCVTYRMVMTYFVDTYDYYVSQKCPVEHLTCCKDHILVVGHCYHILEIYGNAELLQQVNELGIVIPPLNVGK